MKEDNQVKEEELTLEDYKAIAEASEWLATQYRDELDRFMLKYAKKQSRFMYELEKLMIRIWAKTVRVLGI